jgi:hypothetical protein
VAQHEATILGPEALLGLDQKTDAGRVEEIDRRHVEDHRDRVPLRELEQHGAQPRRGAVLDLAADRDDRSRVAQCHRQGQADRGLGFHAGGA